MTRRNFNLSKGYENASADPILKGEVPGI